MKNSLQKGLFEIFYYLIPGAILIHIALHYQLFALPFGGDTFDSNSLMAVISYYIAGQLLSILTKFIDLLHAGLKQVFKLKEAHELISFYAPLKATIAKTFITAPSEEDVYQFCMRVATEKCENSTSTIDRLLAMSLFAKNMTMTSLACGLFASLSGDTPLLILFALCFLTFLCKYYELKRDTKITVYRTAFVFFSLPAPKPEQG